MCLDRAGNQDLKTDWDKELKATDKRLRIEEKICFFLRRQQYQDISVSELFFVQYHYHCSSLGCICVAFLGTVACFPIYSEHSMTLSRWYVWLCVDPAGLSVWPRRWGERGSGAQRRGAVSEYLCLRCTTGNEKWKWQRKKNGMGAALVIGGDCHFWREINNVFLQIYRAIRGGRLWRDLLRTEAWKNADQLRWRRWKYTLKSKVHMHTK